MIPSNADRLATLTSWYADWKGTRVAVIGLGVTGFAVADTLAELGAELMVFAPKPDEERAKVLEILGVQVVNDPLESVPDELIAFAPDLLMVSPGFAPHHPVMKWADSAGLAVWGDIELAWRVRDKVKAAHWILVTGTNGKTTTTRLATAFINAQGYRVAPCGNIGIPVLDAVRDPQGFDVLVVELSSYQLHNLKVSGPGAILPVAAACLNLADDHLDWHGSFDAYRAAKAKVYANTKIACVYNRADDATRAMVENADVQAGARAIGFGLDVPGPSDLGVVDGILCDRAFLVERQTSALELVTLAELEPLGLAAPHMVQNILAAAALSRAVDVEVSAIRRALLEFQLDAHRIEDLGTAYGVRWIDDSKATNPHAAEASLRAFKSIVWIVGGLLKGVDIDSLVAANAGRLKGAVVIGKDRSALLSAFERHAPGLPVLEVTSDQTEQVMVEAVNLAASIAQLGDTVLLAPAAASMDQFVDYADRGRQFQSAVRTMLRGVADDGNNLSGDGFSAR